MAKHCTSSSSSSSSSIVPYLPEEILRTEIFTRLPAKGVGKCRCLSKEWYAKLSTSEFISMHLNRKIDRQENTLLLQTLRGEAILCTMPSRTSDNSFLSKRIDLQFTYEGRFQIENTCHGLVLLHTERGNEMLLELVNPVTREQLTIPKPPLVKSKWINCPALGYDSSAMDYKIAYLDDNGTMEPPFVHVYSVKTGIWKRYDFPFYGIILCSRPEPGKVVLNGVIHWLVFMNIPQSHTDIIPGAIKFVIISFDLSTGVFGEIASPSRNTTRLCLPHVLGECFCILHNRLEEDAELTDLWVMKGYGVLKSWAKLASWQLEENDCDYRYEPVCLNGKDEEILMQTHAGAFVVYNIEEQNAVDVVVDGSEGPFSAGHSFVESLVSPMPMAVAN